MKHPIISIRHLTATVKHFAATALLLTTVAIGASAQKSASQIRIYLNPGHGSWGPNDRPAATIPYPMLAETGRPDTCGFYESNTNLWKILKLGSKLVENGFKASNVVYSRVANGPYPYVAGASNQYKYNRNLSEICEEVEVGNFDMFLSVHSNAATDGAIANYALFLYRGHDDGSGAADGAKRMCQTVWPYIQTNGIDYYTSYGPSRPNIRGDIDFYHSSSTATRSNGKKYTGYLGVLKHGVPGFLSEGYFHTYQPARHRALNKDYCGQEGIRYLRGILDYFNLPAEKVGYLMGTVKDAIHTITHDLYKYKSGTDDQWFPINGARVRLLRDGVVVDEYHTDQNFNGVFVFSDLTPGQYTLECAADNYNPLSATYKKALTVTANATTYTKLLLSPKDGYVPSTTPSSAVTEHVQYAYNLAQTVGTSQADFTFSATGDAPSGTITLTDTTTKKQYAFPVSQVDKGDNQLSIPTSQLPDGVYSWSVSVNNEAVTSPSAFFTFKNTTGATGLVANTQPSSKNFGYLYIADGYTAKGVYQLSPALETLNSAPLFNSTFEDDTYSPGRLSINPNNGYVFISDRSVNHSGIFSFSPYQATPILNIFTTGTRNSDGVIKTNNNITGTCTTGLAFTGSRSNTRLYAFEIGYPETDDATLCRYDVAKSYTWRKPISATYSDVSGLLLNRNVNIVGGPDGVWLAQTRNSGNNTSSVPALIYMSEDGKVKFNSGTDLPSLTGCNGGGLAIDSTRGILAISNADGDIELYNLAWSASGVPQLTYKTKIVSNGGVINQMAFDYAGNLYVAARYSIKGYTIPGSSSVVTTPASALVTIGNPTGIRELHGQSKTDADAIYDLQGRKLSQPRQGINIINGKKVYISR